MKIKKKYYLKKVFLNLENYLILFVKWFKVFILYSNKNI